MSLHVVVGAGPIGSGAATSLADSGHEVKVVTRSGTGPEHPLVQRVRLNAADALALVEVCAGAVAVYNCANPAYHRWVSDWPPLAASLLAAAQAHDAVLATVSNLYAYGPVAGPITAAPPDAPHDHKGEVRARMWASALEAHRSGKVRAVEVRAGDHIDAGARSVLGHNVPALLAGRRLRVLGDPDQPHTWTSTADTVRALLRVSADASTHGRVWLVPSNPPRTQRQALADLAAAAGVPAPRVVGTSMAVLRVGGLFSPLLRELRGTYYQFDRPFVVDDRETRERLGLQPEPWPDVLARVVDAARPRTV